ncbi:hypothetical protein [Streptomyces massasporeus]|uniref:hypothetical protein n=1 Tax=Streptomyces massasporeus TaxID=67324 RepID=UPI00368DEA9B
MVIDSGGKVREQVWRDMSLRVTDLDALPNARFVVQGHNPAGDQNAQIVGRDGRRRRSFTLGRAAEFLMADRRHHVWSAYGDEGVYIDPISAAGLVRWDSGGNRQWEYTPPEGSEYIDTVYAFNVDDGVVVS